MIQSIVSFIERMNFSYPQGIVGNYFPEIIALLSVLFGGIMLLYGYTHHKYYMAMLGIIVGGVLGLILKNYIAHNGRVATFAYVTVCSLAGLAVTMFFSRLIGIFLGGFLAACVAIIIFPAIFQPGESTYVALSFAFLLGGGLGAIFPRFFFIVNCSLIGSIFVTFGISTAIIGNLFTELSPHTKILMHTLVFLPLFIFGIIYQSKNTPEEDELSTESPKKATAKA